MDATELAKQKHASGGHKVVTYDKDCRVFLCRKKRIFVDAEGKKRYASCWDLFHDLSITNQPMLCCWTTTKNRKLREGVVGWSCSNPDASKSGVSSKDKAAAEVVVPTYRHGYLSAEDEVFFNEHDRREASLRMLESLSPDLPRDLPLLSTPLGLPVPDMPSAGGSASISVYSSASRMQAEHLTKDRRIKELEEMVQALKIANNSLSTSLSAALVRLEEPVNEALKRKAGSMSASSRKTPPRQSKSRRRFSRLPHPAGLSMPAGQSLHAKQLFDIPDDDDVEDVEDTDKEELEEGGELK